MRAESLWLFAVAGGALLLGLALLWGMLQSRRRADQIDPGVPGDDPSKGMGADDDAGGGRD